MTTRLSEWLEHFIDTGPGTVIPFSREMADVASHAFRTFGRGSGHPARLNFGDCLAYAVSAVMRAPLLFKGGDFGRTDAIRLPANRVLQDKIGYLLMRPVGRPPHGVRRSYASFSYQAQS
jgi:hypothetical protein